MIRPKHDTSTGQFKGLYEAIGFLVVRGATEEIFFNYGFDQSKSKILYSHYRRKIPSSFSGTIFNHRRSIIENGEVENNYSNLYYFLPSITDRLEEINKYLNNVSVTPINISQNQLNTWADTDFNPAELNLFGMNKTIMYNAVIKCLKYMNDISNSNLTRNADGVLSRREIDISVDWIGENSQRIPPQKFKTFY